MLSQDGRREEEEMLSSEEEKPFTGKKRKNDPRELDKKEKPEYKKKKISLKGTLWMHQLWKIQSPLSQYHVYNFHNILAINQRSLLDPNCEESFVSSKFYMKKVSNVIISHKCLFFTLTDLDNEVTPISLLCHKLRSLGNAQYFSMAETIQNAGSSLEALKKEEGKQTIEEQKLMEFVEEMSSRPFFSQYSPKLLIISNAFLELLGYSGEQLAIESIKHKTILQEFFSAEHYTQIIHKHLQNIQLMKNFLEGAIDINEFCNQSSIVCEDYLYTRDHKKIRCNFFGGASKQLTPYIEIKNPTQTIEEGQCSILENQKQKIKQFKKNYKAREFEVLRKLIDVPKHEDPSFQDKICNYKALTTHQVISDESSP